MKDNAKNELGLFSDEELATNHTNTNNNKKLDYYELMERKMDKKSKTKSKNKRFARNFYDNNIQ